jgi:hypothetical protein
VAVAPGAANRRRRAPVRKLLAREAGGPLGQLCDRLLEELVGDGVADDVAVLAVRAHPLDAPRPPEAGPERMPPAVLREA